MSHPSLKKIFGIGPLGGLISIGMLLLAAWIDRHAGWGAMTPHEAEVCWLGGLLILLGLGVHCWSFVTLRQWWMDNQLCTRGPFHYVRHPMYAAWISLIAPGLVLILNRWIYLLWLLALHPIWIGLVRREERTMERHFGETYRRYAVRTGRFVPRLKALNPPRS